MKRSACGHWLHLSQAAMALLQATALATGSPCPIRASSSTASRQALRAARAVIARAHSCGRTCSRQRRNAARTSRNSCGPAVGSERRRTRCSAFWSSLRSRNQLLPLAGRRAPALRGRGRCARRSSSGACRRLCSAGPFLRGPLPCACVPARSKALLTSSVPAVLLLAASAWCCVGRPACTRFPSHLKTSNGLLPGCSWGGAATPSS
mmetsp:Transcript_75729/g.245104  ORF Transcript_75729/g.245104 Transcript_75729/m.245104 type:complete len:207 (+) Transcript_75729:1712-2332(+)